MIQDKRTEIVYRAAETRFARFAASGHAWGNSKSPPRVYDVSGCARTQVMATPSRRSFGPLSADKCVSDRRKDWKTAWLLEDQWQEREKRIRREILKKMHPKHLIGKRFADSHLMSASSRTQSFATLRVRGDGAVEG